MPAMPVLLLDWLSDEVCKITLNGRELITMTHDEHGWDGMAGIREALLAAATAAGWTVRINGDEGI